MRRAAVVLTLLVAVLVAAPVALAGGGNNIVMANNTDGSNVARSNLLVSHAGGPTVTSTNLALANSVDCNGCRTVAAAIQAVLITSDAQTIEPVNVAAASNGGCTGCQTYAYAAQYVLTTGGPVFLTPGAETTIAGLRAEVASDVASGVPFDLLTTELNDVYARFKAVIDQDLQQAGHSATGTSSTWVDPFAGA
jgi:hypothetical protein